MADYPEIVGWRDSIPSETRSLTKTAYIAFSFTLGIFFLWALTVPLSGAVVSNGKIFSKVKNTVLQHPYGGVVKELYVQDGGSVRKGDLIAVIQPEAAVADLAQMKAKREMLLAARRRLEEKNTTLEHGFSFGALRGVSIDTSYNGDSNSSISIEQDLLGVAQDQKEKGELEALEAQVESLQAEYNGKREQISQFKELQWILEEQYTGLSQLVKDGHIAKAQLWEIQSRRLSLASDLSSVKGERDSLLGKIEEAQQRIKAQKAEYLKAKSTELSEILLEIASIEERLNAASDAYSNTKIFAAIDGVITNLTVNSVGNVIQPAEQIGEIVPREGPFLVEVNIAPSDVSSVKIGTPADVVVTALNGRLNDPYEGTVEYISADSNINENTGLPYFTTHVRLGSNISKPSEIHSGMYAQVYIKTEARTFLNYILAPITDSFRKAFNEG